ncbi:HTH-type transcriptional regulator TreR (plasmid) [Duffyella gerundensis]|jgi:LacI family trehalose operon transcriptional repressor|uniref:HTH-type transcriptional regulator TreR n=1 Tax=Duffyella gerundensis TaxID=1619313 RepID=A0A0U5L9G4_9GAMM|nr:trehalose operon repressor TreR [Duffyella gerundensis]UCB32954.1 HTH-type transcriptional regulator TreR [Duffyella gerundensis]CUU25744.1 HTH-type transcriptional regulator TreR [Duffyella gerundensis]
MNEKKLTLNDIARLSGVGKSTVSLVINNSDKVKASTRQHVEAIIDQYGYTPSKSAQALRSQREKIIGVIVTRLDSVSENQVVRAILPDIYAQKYDAILMESLLDPQLLEDHLHVLEQRNVEGVILFGFSEMNKKSLKVWKDKMVIIASAIPGFASVTYDNAGAVNILMEKMKNQGHQNVSYIGVTNNDQTTGSARYQAYLTCCEKYGYAPSAALGDLSYQSGYDLAKRSLTAETRALICATDTIALGAIKYIREQSWDIKVGSIGCTPLMTFLEPGITSVELGYQSAGLKSSQLLFAMLRGESGPQGEVIPFRLS